MSRSDHVVRSGACPSSDDLIQMSFPKHGSLICPFVSVVYRSSLVHKLGFVWRAIFDRTNQGTHQGWMPHFQNQKSKRNYFISEMGKIWLSLYVFDTNLLTFDCFKGLLMLSFIPFTFLLFCILFILKSHCMLCLKGNWRENVWKLKAKSKKKKKSCGYPKHLFELLVTANACVQRYIFYEKKQKLKRSF